MNSFFAGNREVMDTIKGSKMIFLRGQFALLAVFLGVVYACIVLMTGDYQFLKWHVLLIGSGIVAFYLNRKAKYLSSTLVLFVLTNTFVYLFTAVGRPQDGMFFYYFITNTLCIILVGYRYYLLIIALVLITLALAILAYLHPVQIISVPNDLTTKHEQVIFLINLSISLLFGAYVIISLMRENTLVEDQLISSHDELSKTNEELDRFVYSASHDMRAPLSSLLGLISVAEKTESHEEMRLCLTMMRERVNVMDGFI
jgi:signal transduction histidine kinase